jgi:hypothetical protein
LSPKFASAAASTSAAAFSVAISRATLDREVGQGGECRSVDPIEVCDQAGEQGIEQPDLLVGEVAQYLTITPEQDGNRVRQARFCDRRQCDAAAAPIGRVGRALNQPVPLHAGEHLCHRRLLDLGEAGEIALRAYAAIPKCDQHRQMSNAEAKRLEPRFAKAGEPTRRETDQVSRRRKHI